MLGMKSRRSSMGRATERTGGLLREVLGAGARFTSKLCRNTRGVIALKFALAVPGLAVLVLGGVDLYAVQADRARLQSATVGVGARAAIHHAQRRSSDARLGRAGLARRA